MHRVSPAGLARPPRWRPRLADCPAADRRHAGRPCRAWTFDAAKGARVGRGGGCHGAGCGGSLWSPPAPAPCPEVVDAFARTLRVPHRLYRWRRDDPDNPYLGFLALAHRIVVTSDSMSMLVEATATATVCT